MAVDRDHRPPPGYRRLTEALSLAPRLIGGFGHLGPRGPANGTPVLVIPGFLATDRTTMALRRAFAEAGFRVYPWALGLNRGARADTLERLEARLLEIGGGGKVVVVGWSLGGLYAREIARHRPDLVAAVVTLGSPFSGDIRGNHVWRLYEWVAGHPVDRPPVPRITDKPPVPALALWSRRDGIVAPACARGEPDEADRSRELRCNHMGFAVSRTGTRMAVRETQRFLADQLGQTKPAAPGSPPR